MVTQSFLWGGQKKAFMLNLKTIFRIFILELAHDGQPVIDHPIKPIITNVNLSKPRYTLAKASTNFSNPEIQGVRRHVACNPHRVGVEPRSDQKS